MCRHWHGTGPGCTGMDTAQTDKLVDIPKRQTYMVYRKTAVEENRPRLLADTDNESHRQNDVLTR